MRLTAPQQRMVDALTYLAGQPDTFRPGIACRGAQHRTARVLDREGLAHYFPAIGVVEPTRDMFAVARLETTS